MEFQQLMTDGYERILQILERVLTGLTRDDLRQQPHPDSNSIGWLAWHLTRIHDQAVANLMGEEQLWVKDGWHAKFNREPDPTDTGFGHSAAEVAALKVPDAESLLEYSRAVLERTKRYINTLSPTDLDRELNEPRYQPLPTVGVRLVSVMSDNLQHAGQTAYLRGFLKGKGWQRA